MNFSIFSLLLVAPIYWFAEIQMGGVCQSGGEDKEGQVESGRV